MTILAPRRILSLLLLAVSAPIAALGTSDASAQDGASPARQASAHFQRGVALYGEADYRAALVEFKRACAIAPNAGVLYNVGEAQFQLQDYAGALATFERFIADGAPGDGHRAEVEANLEVLRTRVGHVGVTTVPSGADVTVDDQSAGRTPFDRALLVSVGHRKVVATLTGRQPVTRYVDVAAGDNLAVTLSFPPAEAPATAFPRSLPTTTPELTPASHAGATWRTIGWSTSGLLAAGAVTFGILASRESSTLAAQRGTYPVSASTLNRDASLTQSDSIVADALTAGAILIGGITVLSTVLAHSSSSTQSASVAPRLVLGPGSARLEGAF